MSDAALCNKPSCEMMMNTRHAVFTINIIDGKIMCICTPCSAEKYLRKSVPQNIIIKFTEIRTHCRYEYDRPSIPPMDEVILIVSPLMAIYSAARISLTGILTLLNANEYIVVNIMLMIIGVSI